MRNLHPKSLFAFTLAAAVTLAAGTAQGAFVTVEDWDGFSLDVEPHVSANWTRNNVNDSHGRIASDPAGGGDQVLKLTSGFSGRGYYTNLGSNALPDNAVSTLLFRFYSGGATVQARLTDHDVITTQWFTEDRAGVGITSDNALSGVPITGGVWYNAWLVVDLVNDMYDIYLSEGADAAALVLNDVAIQLNSSSSSVDNTPDALDTFMLVLGQPQNTGNSSYIGDIMVDTSGANLTNPFGAAAVPAPAALPAGLALMGIVAARRRRA